MPELTPEEALNGGIGTSSNTCPKCKSAIVKLFCGRHDLVYYECQCPFEQDPKDPYHLDHSDCWRR